MGLENQNGYVFPLKHADGKYKGCGTCSTAGSVAVHAKEPKKSVCGTIQKWATSEQFSSKVEVKGLISEAALISTLSSRRRLDKALQIIRLNKPWLLSEDVSKL